MSEFQLTHVALVGARMDAFRPLGFKARSELAMRRVIPDCSAGPLTGLPRATLKAHFARQLPYWVHNVITDPGFPQRTRLMMSLRRFEGELRDNRENEVVAVVLSHGFRNRELNPGALPDSMPMRQRCSLLMQIDCWQDAYRQLEGDFTSILTDEVSEVEQWIATSQPEIDYAVAG